MHIWYNMIQLSYKGSPWRAESEIIMKYYQVKPQYDQKRKYPHTSNFDILISEELYTEEELMDFNANKSCFTEIELEATDTFYSFGARFANIG